MSLVGHRVGVLSHLDGLRVVVDADGYHVLTAFVQHLIAKIIHMRHRERILRSFKGVSVYPHLAHNVRTLQVEFVIYGFLTLCQCETLLIPCLAHIVLVGGQEELQLHVLARISVLRHVGVEEIAGVVERAHPFRIDTDIVALQSFGHAGRQHDPVVHLRLGLIPSLRLSSAISVYLELPFASKVHLVVGIGKRSGHQNCCNQGKKTIQNIRFHFSKY